MPRVSATFETQKRTQQIQLGRRGVIESQTRHTKTQKVDSNWGQQEWQVGSKRKDCLLELAKLVNKSNMDARILEDLWTDKVGILMIEREPSNWSLSLESIDKKNGT